VDDAGCNGQLPFHPLGISGELSVPCIGQVESVEQFTRPGFTLLLSNPIQGRTKAKILKSSQLRIEIALVRHYAGEMLGRLGICCAVDACDPDRSRVRPGQTCQHVDGGGLARTVGAEETEQFALGHLDTYIRNRLNVSKSLGKPLNGNRIHLFCAGTQG